MFFVFVFLLIGFNSVVESKCQLSCQDTYATHTIGVSLIDTCNDMES